jgi:hypothetical protein
MPHRVAALDSLGRKTWPWIVFDRAGHAVCRGAQRLEAQRRAERAEGRYAHRQFLIVKNEKTGEAWARLGGSWFPRAQGRAA